MRIVVLDSKPFLNHPVFKNRAIRVFSEERPDKWEHNCECSTDLYPHGTAICGIITLNIPENVELYCFDIFDAIQQKMLDKLISALMYIYNNVECDIINISLGVRYPNENLKNICKKLSERGITIVAAFDNAGAISYPAAYSFVIGVDTSPRCIHKDDFVYVNNSPITIRGKGNVQRVPWIDPLYTINQGSSFAAPYITSYIAKSYLLGVKPTELLDYLQKHAKYVYDFAPKKNRCFEFKMKRVALFPFNKEMTSLITFQKYLSYLIVGIYDTKYSGHVGLTASGLYDDDVYTIKNIEECDWDDIDTMVVGHVSEQEGRMGRNIKEEILDLCFKHRVSVYSYDNESVSKFKDSFKKRGLTLFSAVDFSLHEDNSFGKLYMIKSPVLGFFGTTKSQGKFTTQLQLRYKLLEKGFSVGQLGTEPNSYLFGIDEMYPFGYNGITGKNEFHEITHINYLMHQIDNKNPDIILVGSQSGTIPMAYYNIGQLPIKQMSFLIATKPDGVILCVNIDDDFLYVKRSLQAIESIGRNRVVGISIYPFSYVNGWGIINKKKRKVDIEYLSQKKNEFEEYFQVPIIVSGEKNTGEELLKICIDFFGRKRL